MSAVSHPPETNSDIVTSWLPVTSAWPAVPECQTGGIYSQYDAGAGGALALAYDPYFGLNIDHSLSCLPPFATLWWQESASLPILTKTSLGPLVCPEAYTTATTSAVNSQSTFVACCPSGYTFLGVKDAGSVGECTSTLTIGQLMTYVDLTSLQTSTATIKNSGAAVYAIHINGYNFAASTTSGSAAAKTSSGVSSTGSSTTTSSNTVASQTQSSSSTSSPTNTPVVSSSSLSTGAKVGIGLGVAAGIIGIGCLIAALFFLRRKSRNEHLASNAETLQMIDGKVGGQQGYGQSPKDNSYFAPPVDGTRNVQHHAPQELDSAIGEPRGLNEMHEMGGVRYQ